jgi:hypothetical protein
MEVDFGEEKTDQKNRPGVRVSTLSVEATEQVPLFKLFNFE